MNVKLTVNISEALAEWLESQSAKSGETSEQYCIEILSAYQALEEMSENDDISRHNRPFDRKN